MDNINLLNALKDCEEAISRIANCIDSISHKLTNEEYANIFEAGVACARAKLNVEEYIGPKQ